ncbi:hypothetical protein D047_5101B, partial [Vibrio parahaemolyticus VPTS-2010_2]
VKLVIKSILAIANSAMVKHELRLQMMLNMT